MKQTDTQWLVLYTKVKHEKKVCELFAKNEITFFHPTFTTIKQWSDRKKKMEVLLFPRIIFVKREDVNLINNLSSSSIVGYLKNNSKFALVKNYEIENIKLLLNEWSGKINEKTNQDFNKYDLVIVEKGKFQGVIGRSMVVNTKHKLVIEIETLGNFIMLEIPKSMVRKI